MKPRIFISSVSAEFASTRDVIAKILLRLGYEPEWEEIFHTEDGEIPQNLREKIEGCHGLIHLVGQGYGTDCPEDDQELGRVSYTQFEFLHARRKGRKTWLILPGSKCHRDRNTTQLLSSDGATKRTLQANYEEWIRSGNHLYHEPKNDTELELTIER